MSSYRDMLVQKMKDMVLSGRHEQGAEVGKIILEHDREQSKMIVDGKYDPMHDMALPLSRPRIVFSLEEKLSARMNWHAWGAGFDHVAAHAAGDKIFVWVLTKDLAPVTIEDEAAMYPSDALVTKLRLMQHTGSSV